MLVQLSIGSAAMIATVLASATFAYIAIESLYRAGPWLVRVPHSPKFLIVMIATLIGTMTTITICVWSWALTFHALSAFADLETALYFAFATFTTLGFGDVLLPIKYRLLSGMAATNGLLLFGLHTAFLVEVMRRIRTEQLKGRPDPE